MLSDLAMPVGFTGVMSFTPARSAVAMGLQPSDCAPKTFQPLAGADTRPISTSSVNALSTLVNSSPLAIGMTTCSGSRQPSCSATS